MKKLIIITPLVVAVGIGFVLLAQQMSRTKALAYKDLRVEDVFVNMGARELALAAARGETHKIDELLNQGVEVDSIGLHGFTPLRWAISLKNHKGFSYLLKCGANPNARMDDNWQSIMHLAASMRDTRFLKELLESGGDPNLVDLSSGRTPIFSAVMGKNIDNLKILLKSGADPNHQDMVAETAAMHAVIISNYEAAYLLIENGADPLLRDKGGRNVRKWMEGEMENIDRYGHMLLKSISISEKEASLHKQLLPVTDYGKLENALAEITNTSPIKVANGSRPTVKDAQWLQNSLGMHFIYIPPGTFKMGSPSNENGREPSELLHTVILSKGYYLSVTEVSQAQWKAVMGSNPSQFKGDDRPVEMVSWHDVVMFCRRLSEIEGMRYRLPTEAEWEYACRAGTSTPFNTGETISSNQANIDGRDIVQYNNGPPGILRNQTTAIASIEHNGWGLFDMHGNVREWCSDQEAPYPNTSVVDPKGPMLEQADRIVRGGSWHTIPRYSRSAFRLGLAPMDRSNHLGFRVVLDLTE